MSKTIKFSELSVGDIYTSNIDISLLGKTLSVSSDVNKYKIKIKISDTECCYLFEDERYSYFSGKEIRVIPLEYSLYNLKNGKFI